MSGINTALKLSGFGLSQLLFCQFERKLIRKSNQPCCVCKDEKASRDDCMLFSDADDPQEDCKSMVDKYKSCMAGYGFKI